MKIPPIALLIAAVILFAIAAQPGEEKQFKKTGASDVMFRTSSISYATGATTIAFNLACDGSVLNQYTRQSWSQNFNPDCSAVFGTPIINNLPGTQITLDAKITCQSPIGLYFHEGAYNVCCKTSVAASSFIVYSGTPTGTQPATSTTPANELMCAAEEPPPSSNCSISFQDYVDYGNRWINCESNTC
jgi:hypothetical protein